MSRAFVVVLLMVSAASAQEAKTSSAEQKTSQTTSEAAASAPKTTPINVTRAQRLGAAKTAYIKRVEGSEIPANVITNSIEGWGRYTLAPAPEKADLLIEITSPEDQQSSVTINGSRSNPLTGYPEQMSSTSRNLSNNPIKMTVYDAKTRLPLWSATEQPKRAMKQKSREDNLVEAAQALFSKFHQAVEPNAP